MVNLRHFLLWTMTVVSHIPQISSEIETAETWCRTLKNPGWNMNNSRCWERWNISVLWNETLSWALPLTKWACFTHVEDSVAFFLLHSLLICLRTLENIIHIWLEFGVNPRTSMQLLTFHNNVLLLNPLLCYFSHRTAVWTQLGKTVSTAITLKDWEYWEYYTSYKICCKYSTFIAYKYASLAWHCTIFLAIKSYLTYGDPLGLQSQR